MASKQSSKTLAKQLKTATYRLKKEYLQFKKNPDPSFVAEPLPTNILEWRYVIRGGNETPFAGGYYYGKILFPARFPFESPSLYVITPNGRFSTAKLCLGIISNYHKEDWNPAVSISGMLACFMGVMCEELNDFNRGMGSLQTSDEIKKEFAYKSLEFNLRDKLFCELFPEIVVEIKEILEIRSKNSARQDNEKKLDEKEKSSDVQNTER